nr:Morn repeat protein [Pandoravirus massiliensis]
MERDALDSTHRAPTDSTFSLLPDEIVLAILRVAGTPDVAARAAPVSRRMARLAADPALWQYFHATRYGTPLLHKHFAEFGKDWRWLCRARSCRCHKSPAQHDSNNDNNNDNNAGADSQSIDVGESNDIECGHIRLADRHFYWGDLQKGTPHGYGLYMSVIRARGDRRDHLCACALLAQSPPVKWTVHYEGQWHQGQYHGRGFSLVLADRRHEIDFARANRHYQGDFVEGKLHGQGRLQWDDGSMFCGRFENGSRHSPGLYVWPNGNRYDGEWSHCERHGQGTFTWTKKGYSLQCSWRQNRAYGWGVCTWNGGQRLEALWKGFDPQAEGVFVAPDGRRFIDTASDIFTVGSAAIADDVDPQGEWGGRFRRLREIRGHNTDDGNSPHADQADAVSTVKVIEATYPDYSRVLSKWRRDGGVTREVLIHSVACAQACDEESTSDRRSSVPHCMACLYAKS